MFKKNIFYLFFILTIFFIDRLTKYWAIKNLNIEYSGFEAQVEIIKKLSASGCTFGECALFLEKRLYGVSKMNYILTILGVLKILLTK